MSVKEAQREAAAPEVEELKAPPEASTAVVASKREARKARMCAEELERSEKVLTTYAKPKNGPGHVYFHPDVLRAFVEACYDAHEPLIERWGGWRWHTHVDQVAPLAARQVEEAWVASALPGTHAATLSPVFAHRIWRYRTLEADPGAYEGDDYIDCSNVPIVDIPLTERTPACPPGVCKDCDALRAAGEKGLEVLVQEWIDKWQAKAPKLSTKIRPRQTIAKAVLRALQGADSGVPEAQLAQWTRFFERMGQVWAAQRTWRLTMSCAPSSFLKLGHYGENSCYGCWGGSGYDKTVIAVVPNSVVLLMYTGEEGAAEQLLPEGGAPVKGPVSGRAWGWLFDEPGAKGVAFQNIYNVYWEQADLPLRAAVARYFGLSEEAAAKLKNTTTDRNWTAGYGTYSNNDARIITVDGSYATMQAAHQRTLALRTDYDRFKNAGRGGLKSMAEMPTVRVCPNCLRNNAVTDRNCGHCGRRIA